MAAGKPRNPRDGAWRNVTNVCGDCPRGTQRLRLVRRFSQQAYVSRRGRQMRSSGKSRGWRVLGVAGLLVVLGSVWVLLGRGSAPSAERRETTPVLSGAEADRIVSERVGFGAPLAMTTASPIRESQDLRAAPGAFLQHLPHSPRESVEPASRRLSRIDLQPFDPDRLAGASVRPHFRMVAAFVVRRKREQLPVRCRPGETEKSQREMARRMLSRCAPPRRGGWCSAPDG